MDRKVPVHKMSKIRFYAYTSREIENLSVIQITNPETLNLLGHSSQGGLHDPALGPNSNNELCASCGLNSNSCPGHFGHIKLPLLVYNPFFFDTMYKLLRGSCFKCHCLLAPESAGHLLLAQLQALDHGLVGLSEELEQIALDGEDDKGNAQNLVLIEKLSAAVQSALGAIDCNEAMKSAHVKNVVDCKQKIIRNFQKQYLMSGSRKCPRCLMTQSGLAAYNKCKVVFTSKPSSRMQTKTPKKKSIRLKDDSIMNPEISDEEPNEEDLSQQNYLSPTEAHSHLKALWENEDTLLQRLFGSICNNNIYSDTPADIFFLDVVAVPPTKYRPMNLLNGMTSESPQTSNLKVVLKYSIVVRSLLCQIKKDENMMDDVMLEHVQLLIDRLIGKTLTEKLNAAWIQLQVVVNCVLDSELDKLNKKANPGVKQVLEKKEGLFRKHMMGKRVNYAARSVISPDPYIGVNEIGIPHVFATRLTYPQPVTPWNVQELKSMVINGPNIYPGATLIRNQDGSCIRLSSSDKKQREAVAKQLLTPMDTLNKGHQIKTVYRHLINGDVLLLNRQPTLHKPSIMAHKARILPGEKTLRLHYANCKCYNADFDGDEMNAHFPQSELSRSEAYTLALVDNQYLVPKDGTPLSGLIQDHVISGCLMSIRGRFFNRNDYQELVYSALVNQTSAIKTLPPSLLKPEVLWSGKQIISTVIINIIPQGEYLLNLDSKSKTSVKNWNLETARKWLAGGDELEDLDMTESEVIIRSGELLCGILDKAHYGSSQYGLVHCCQELYGGSVSVKLLTAFSRLFTYFLQFHGFTLGIEDILVLSKANKKRKKLIKASTKVGDEYTCKALSVDEALGKDYLTGKMREAHFSRNDLKQKQIDMVAKEMTDRFNNEINTVCLPSGLLKKFPHNNLQLMVQSGAKGSTVNTMQISGLLGQIELEGRRPPLMISGHSLPSFLPYETSPRSRGFVTGRFLTGIRPQEYFFHCMAGREGLIDTAVKTSRSGYLQRCLIKHLEGIVINYDMTVRDSDGSIIQFLYGDDGLDILKTQFMKPSQLSFLNENMKAMINHDQTDQLKGLSDLKSVSKLKKKIKKRRKAGFTKSLSSSYGFLLFSRGYKNGGKSEKDFNIKSGRSNYAEKICSDWRKLDAAEKDVYTSQMLHIPDPVISVHRPDRNFSSVTERLDEMISDYLKSNKTKVDESEFKEMFYLKAIRAICEPGEAVGLLAAQSIGEPSTQMTLNTFHFAGRGEMNVTLGIPRLREILMVASANIATPSMIVPLKENCYLEGDRLRLKMNKIYLNDLLETVTIEETINIKSSSMHYRDYKLKIKFLPFKVYKDKYFTTPSKNLKFIETYFLKILCNGIKQKLLSMAESKFVSVGSSKKAATFNDMTSNAENLELPPTANDENSSDEEGQGDEDTTAAKLKSRHDQDQEYDESDGDDVSDLSDEEQHDSSMKQEPEDEEDEAESLNKSVDRSKKEKKILKEKEMRIHDVLVSHNWVVGYNFDHKKEQWCEITLRFDLEGSKFDMAAVFEEVAKKTVVHQVDKINKALLTPDDEPDPKLTVDGVNITEMFKHGEILDLNRLYSNHIHEVANSYGIEAARNVIVKEVVNVFGVYGIEVDRRHLSLIADYMTFEGSYKPFNRVGMESNASPIQQMTFETTLQFLKSAVLSGYEDQLNSPSSRIVVGKLVGGGTGSFELLQKPYQTDSFQYNDTCFSKQKA